MVYNYCTSKRLSNKLNTIRILDELVSYIYIHINILIDLLYPHVQKQQPQNWWLFILLASLTQAETASLAKLIVLVGKVHRRPKRTNKLVAKNYQKEL